MFSDVLALSTAVQAGRQTDAENIGEVFARELAEKTRELIDAYPDLNGRVKIRMTIQKNGIVSLAEAKDSRLNDSEPLTRILEMIYKWRFTPLPIEESNVRITHIMQFGTRFDSTRIFFVVMGAIIGTITFLIVLVRIG